jgi:ADP-heptose:LPS heptosyltransferase
VYLKHQYPDCDIVFLGRNYTRDIAEICPAVDSFISWDDISTDPVEKLKKLNADAIIHVFPRKEIAKAARKAGIQLRVGTSHRTFHWLNCNRRINFTRKNSDLHEAQLNFELLKGLDISYVPTMVELAAMQLLSPKGTLRADLNELIDKTKCNLILHPGSRGSAREWGIDRFAELIKLLPADKFKIFLTGTEKEGAMFRNELSEPFPQVTDLSGKLSLCELIGFIGHCNALIAASTGPLHIASALGIHAIGLYPPIRPMHPGRWAPIGKHTKVFVADKECSVCRKTAQCACMREIRAADVARHFDAVAEEGKAAIISKT